MSKDETAQSEDQVVQTADQKAEHDRRMSAAEKRNAKRLKQAEDREPSQPEPTHAGKPPKAR